MRWPEERYVRLYSRDTLTWKLLPWQSKCLLPLVMRKLDRAGLLDLNGEKPEEAIAAMTEVPIEFVTVALDALLKRGVFEVNPQALFMPKFREAQEACASSSQRSRESRAAARDLQRAAALGIPVQQNAANSNDSSQRNAAKSNGEQRTATPSLSSLAVPTDPSKEKKHARAPKNGAARPVSNPRHAPLKQKLVAEFEHQRGSDYGFLPKDARAISDLLKLCLDDDEILKRWRRALTAKPPTRCDSLAVFASRWNSYATLQPGQMDWKRAGEWRGDERQPD